MKWSTPPHAEKCPTKSDLVELDENKMFWEAKCIPDKNAISSDDGYILKKLMLISRINFLKLKDINVGKYFTEQIMQSLKKEKSSDAQKSYHDSFQQV